MRQPIRLSLLLTLAFTVLNRTSASAASPAPERKPSAAPQELAAATEANSAFAIDLYQKLAAENPDGNLFLSPLSISIALTMATEGAVDETAEQMRRVLHLPAGNLTPVHRGQAALQQAFLPTPTSPAVTAKIAALRAQLKAANNKTDALQKKSDYQSAITSSQTGSRIANELNALLKQTQPYEFRMANALWVEKTYPLNANYIAAIEPVYGALLFPVDFKQKFEPARQQINGWVSAQTNDRVRDLIPSRGLDKLTRLVITNAVYFNGEWERPFEKAATREEPFLFGEASKPISMMHAYNRETASYGAVNGDGALFTTPREVPLAMRDDDPSLYPDAGGFTSLSLPYRGGKLTMTVLLPRSRDGLAGLEAQLKPGSVPTWLSKLEKRPVQVTLPKFKLESEYKLSGTLQAMGMQRAFRDTVHPDGAQFDKLAASKNPDDKLYISAVLHKTFVDVNEVGTEAAAATAVIIAAPTAARPGEVEIPKTRPFDPIFKADHPFLFLIRDRESGSILFVGRYQKA